MKMGFRASAAVALLVFFAGCNTQDGARYHITEKNGNYTDISPIKNQMNITVDGDASDWAGIQRTFHGGGEAAMLFRNVTEAHDVMGRIYNYRLSGTRFFRGDVGLYILLEIDGSIEKVSKKNREHGHESVRVATINIDVDMDRETGFEAFPCGMAGYDRMIWVDIQPMGTAGYVMWMSYREPSPDGGGYRQWTVPYRRDSRNHPQDIAAADDAIEIFIPEDLLGSGTKDRMRIVMHENAMPGPADCSDEVIWFMK